MNDALTRSALSLWWVVAILLPNRRGVARVPHFLGGGKLVRKPR